MLIISMKRIMVFLMAFVSLFTASGGNKYSDYCGDYDFPRISAEEQEEDTIRIMSFNIRCADVNGTEIKDRLSVGTRQILEVMPDSLGVQEAVPQWIRRLDLFLPMYGRVGVEREEGKNPAISGESCPIYYLKTRYKLTDSGYFWLSETPDVPSLGPGAACKRICTWAKLENRFNGETFVHVNTHFDHVSENARVQGGMILNSFIEENFSDLPVVFTADMNTTEKGSAYKTMTQNLGDARLLAEDSVTFGTFHAGQDPNKLADYYIDFVLCSDDFDVTAYRTLTKGVDDRFTSDHFPIYADMKLKASEE